MKAEIHYLLDEDGRRSALEQGKKGTRVQILKGEINKDLLEHFNVNEDGVPYVTYGFEYAVDEPEFEDGEVIIKIVDYTLNPYSLETHKRITVSPCCSIIEFDEIQVFETLLNKFLTKVEFLERRHDYVCNLVQEINIELERRYLDHL